MSTTQLTGLILPCGECPTIGPEKSKNLGGGVTLFFQSIRTFNPSYRHKAGGSYRFTKSLDGVTVAGLQVMSRIGGEGIGAKVYCHPEWRRKGMASELLRAARGIFPVLDFSDDQSPDGQAWLAADQDSVLARAAPPVRPPR
jgi:GNAT superfamily N-acetyltransferase